jgi:type IV pilus assembly protein PilX
MNDHWPHRFVRPPALPARQHGASLLFALITLVALALAATALVRSVDTGAVVMGNLGAKKATAIAADRATQMAIKFLAQDLTEATRLADNSANANRGYYATSKEDYDITGFDRPTDTARMLVNWDVDGNCDYAKSGGSLVGTCDAATRPSDALNADALNAADPAAARGLEARWLITRLCGTAGIDAKGPSNNNCAVALKASTMKNQNSGSMDSGTTRNLEIPNQQPFYRIVVRVKGPRNAVTYTETIVNLAS